MKNVGFIGLGSMGLPMALNLCASGSRVFFHSSSPASTQRMLDAGATLAADRHEVAKNADVLITMIPSDKEIRALYLEDDSLLYDLPQGAFLIDMTSSSMLVMKELEEQIHAVRPDLHLIDAPVSGGVGGAENGTLTIMASCQDKGWLDGAVHDVLHAMGKNIIYAGTVGCGSAVKFVNNMLMAAHTEMAVEALCTLRALGLDPTTAFEIINGSGGRSAVTENVVPGFLIKDNHDDPNFRLALMEKDIDLFLQEARNAHVFTPVAEMVGQMFKATGNVPGNLSRNFTCIGEWFQSSQP